ncbi:hypothetical protein [Streptomyces sp. PT12]|uniref:hypothetical protein n=1 Tax=Streptomyces sp. PT12 TaxID=1510197 RepID=UPI000DE1F13D|nr:hypothetical protein [Streptomyces sp. PT12]RBM22049.1 hypothetical protein DEH69_04430 [Streptomyces sp. PT12]
MSTTPPRGARSGPDDDEPRPEPIRFYGTSWVEHTRGYRIRRAALCGLAAAGTVAGALLLWFLYAGLAGSGTAGWLRALVVVALVMCSVMAFIRTWSGYSRPRGEDAVDESAFRSIKVVGFVGVFAAYAVRSAVEAPGERLLRADHEAAVARFHRRTAKRSGHPGRRARTGGRKPRRS